MFKNQRTTSEGLEKDKCAKCEEGAYYRYVNGELVKQIAFADDELKDASIKRDVTAYANSLAPQSVNFKFASDVRIKQLSATWLEECAELLTDRGGDYGTREGNIERGITLWNAITPSGHVLQPKHQDLMQFCEKLARWGNKPKWDTACDMLNYLAFYLASEYKDYIKHANNDTH